MDAEGAFVLALDGKWRPETGSLRESTVIKGGTIDLNVDYLRPGKGKHFIAYGNILRVGNKVGVVHTELRNEKDKLIATGTGTYLIG